jgi:hypothetical protein
MLGAGASKANPFFSWRRCALAATPMYLYTNQHRSPLPIRSFNHLVLHHRQDQGKVPHAGFLRPAVEADGDKLYRPLEAQCVPGIGAAEAGSAGAPGGGLELPTEGGTEGSVGEQGGLAGLPVTRMQVCKPRFRAR